jgi:hypothetical protein
MIRTLSLAAALVAGLALPAIAADADKMGASLVVAQEGPATQKPFTMIDAQNLLRQQGYTSVSELVKNEKGVWIGSAKKDSKTVPVGVDVKGNIVERPAT